MVTMKAQRYGESIYWCEMRRRVACNGPAAIQMRLSCIPVLANFRRPGRVEGHRILIQMYKYHNYELAIPVSKYANWIILSI